MQDIAPKKITPKSKAKASQVLHYKLEMANLNAHLFNITLTIAQPAARQQVALAVWIPGSYLVREFSKNLQSLSARQGKDQLSIEHLDKCSWQIACQPNKPLIITYQVYARDNSVRTAWLDSARGFFNATSLCLRVAGQEQASHILEISDKGESLAATRLLADWSVATGLTKLKTNTKGFGSYTAANFDELADCPVEMGTFWSGSFKACGVAHRFVVAGALPNFDGAKLMADAQLICETEIRFWHGSKKPPFKNYLFMLNAVDDGYGGLEHRNSTALICKRQDLPVLNPAKGVRPTDGYTTLKGLISHEYFHTWNVKRMRPAEFASYDYANENYTELLWFFEGFTSYYDDLLLRRAGLLDNLDYLKLLNKTINQVMQTPGRQLQSVAEASFDAWVKYYRQDENTANTTVSYYTKGSLVALCLDLTLRTESQNTVTLDHVMRALWLRCKGGPMKESDLAAVLEELGQRSYTVELTNWVHGKDDLPLKALLEQHGVTVHEDASQLAHRLGLRASEGNSHGLQIKTVLRAGVAEQAGFAPGDEWLGVEAIANVTAKRSSQSTNQSAGWRMNRLDDLTAYAGQAKQVTALIARDKRLLKLTLNMPPAISTWRLTVQDGAAINTWLNPHLQAEI
jgi:predicted metalloprotease with PDZ domain